MEEERDVRLVHNEGVPVEDVMSDTEPVSPVEGAEAPPKETDVLSESEAPPESPKDEETEETSETGEDIELSEAERLFMERGLDKRYGSLENFISSADRYITNLEQERSNWRNQTQEKPREVSQDDFLENPVEALKSMLDDRDKKILARLDEQEVERFIENTKDFATMESKMMEQLQIYPDIAGWPKARALKALYRLAKADLKEKIVSQPPPKTPKSENAQVGPGSQVRKGARTPQDYVNMTPEQLEREIGFE